MSISRRNLLLHKECINIDWTILIQLSCRNSKSAYYIAGGSGSFFWKLTLFHRVISITSSKVPIVLKSILALVVTCLCYCFLFPILSEYVKFILPTIIDKLPWPTHQGKRSTLINYKSLWTTTKYLNCWSVFCCQWNGGSGELPTAARPKDAQQHVFWGSGIATFIP